MTDFAKRELKEWALTLGVGMIGGMIASALTLSWAIHAYH